MSANQPHPASALRVLIADDSHDMADTTACLIEAALGCQASTAYDGLEALRQTLSLHPDAVVLDLRMPGMDGVEVARRVRQHFPQDSPYLIALTGEPDAVRDLRTVDGQFDRVLAKPLDTVQLIATLSRLAAGFEPLARATQAFDFAELFTRVTRQVVPQAMAGHLAYSFDFRGPSVIVEDDPVEVQCGIHRLLLGLVDIMASGFVMFSAEASLDDTGVCTVLIEAAGTGGLREASQLDAVFSRLRLAELPDARSTDAATRQAAGICPNTGASVTCSCDAREGVLLKARLVYPGAVERFASREAEVAGARVWLVDHGEMSSDWGERRLQRLGWRVTRFRSCAGALAVARGLAPGMGPPIPAPALLIVVESADVDGGLVRALRQHLPPETECVFAVSAGSPLLGKPAAVEGFELCVLPFSPLELAQFAERALPYDSSRGGNTMPAPLGLDDRPDVLLVDDNDVNRTVGRALVEALGYEVRTAHDGLDAIDQCRQKPPQLVLMDLEMPVLGGIDASVRLRELQRLGDVAPFAVVAATANASREARDACRAAGMDAFMTKPLNLSELRELLRRFTAVA